MIEMWRWNWLVGVNWTHLACNSSHRCLCAEFEPLYFRTLTGYSVNLDHWLISFHFFNTLFSLIGLVGNPCSLLLICVT
jgi:hypothetical protein